MWRHGTETYLERRLRDERPQPGDEFVGALAARVEPAAVPRRRLIAPRVAVVLATTAVLGASLGVAGALGSASGSVQAFGRGVFHLVQPSRSASSPSVTQTTLPSSVTPDYPAGNGDPTFGSGRVFGLPPFGSEYGGNYPICWQGHIIYVHWWQLFWYFLHGAHSARYCFTHPGP